MFLDDTACNLASMNLLTFLKDGQFQAEDYMHATRLWTLTLEISGADGAVPVEGNRAAVL
jgi:ribonucleoside-diphosphate reductase alpha chain